jgi:hypothetical protein
MKLLSRYMISIVMTMALAPPLLITGCAARVGTGYRVYDPDYRDYHAWDGDELRFYGRWENETHREHRDIRKRRQREQKEYWEWRHHQH